MTRDEIYILRFYLEDACNTASVIGADSSETERDATDQEVDMLRKHMVTIDTFRAKMCKKYGTSIL